MICILNVFNSSIHAYETPTKRISLIAKDASLIEIFSQIENKTNYKFFYKNDDLNLDQVISINIEREYLENLLLKLFEGRAIVFKIKKDKIILKKDKEASYTIKGQIIDKQTGRSISDAHLSSNNKEIVTKEDGVFKIDFKSLPLELTISHINYGKRKVNINQLTNIAIALPPVTHHLNPITISLPSSKEDKQKNSALEALLKNATVIEGVPVFLIKPGANFEFSDIRYHWDKSKKKYTLEVDTKKSEN